MNKAELTAALAMRTKSAGSTNGTGYITPSKPVGRLMLNFMPCPRVPPPRLR